jgi:hypothetical protein
MNKYFQQFILVLFVHGFNISISEQQVTDTNPLFDLAYIPRDLNTPLNLVPFSTVYRSSTQQVGMLP